MGVDYDANYGIGYQIESDVIDADVGEDEFDLIEYIDESLGYEFDYFETGSSSYTGGDDDLFLVIKEPFKNGLDLTMVKKALDKEIERLCLRTTGDFGQVGGLRIW